MELDALSAVKAKLKQYLPGLKKKYPISEMALFGSVTRDDFDPKNSDIDILIDFNGRIGIEFIYLADELELILEKKVDLVSKKGLKPRYWDYLKSRLEYV
jgi:predicted nucleotidyltransferase